MYKLQKNNVIKGEILPAAHVFESLYICRNIHSMDIVAELKWRGMIQDIMPGTEEQLKKESTNVT